MARRRRPHKAADVARHAKAAAVAAGHGHCTRALEELGEAQTAHGRSGARRAPEELADAKVTFFRKCVVPQR